MTLTKKLKDVRDEKVDDLNVRISEKTTMRNRVVEIHTNNLQKLNDEIDEITLMRDALLALK